MIKLRCRFCIVYALSLILLFTGCKQSEVVPQNKVLVSYKSVLSRTSSELKNFLGATTLSPLLVDDITLYSITYKTTFKGSPITASGLVALPKTSVAVPIVSFQHGTIASHGEAPTLLPLGSTDLILYSGLSSAGFIAAVPDYIGFGSSSNVPHPYYVLDATATAVVDMVQAAKELAITVGNKFNGKVFLAGYSQGGYATLAAHQSLELNPITGLTLTASFPASGGYDIKAMQEYFFSLTNYSEPFYLAYVANAYKNQYPAWSQSISDFFNEPYASAISGLLDGTNSSDIINAGLTTNIAALIKADLRANIDTDPKYKYVVDAFRANSLVNWKPAVRVYLYHGDADTTVPYSNSVTTYQKFLANGASPSVVTLTTLPGATHSTGVLPYLQSFIPIMVSLK